MLYVLLQEIILVYNSHLAVKAFKLLRHQIFCNEEAERKLVSETNCRGGCSLWCVGYFKILWEVLCGGDGKAPLAQKIFFGGVWSPQPCEERVSPKLVVGLMVAVVWWAGR